MDSFGENPRGVHAHGMLNGMHDITAADADHRCVRFLPAGVRAADPDPAEGLRRAAGQRSAETATRRPDPLLRTWDYRWGIASMPTSLAVFWGDTLWDEVNGAAQASGLDPQTSDMRVYDYMAEKATPQAAAARVGRSIGSAGKGFRKLGHRLGRDQPLPAPGRFHRSALRRCQTEHPGAVRVVALGFARLVRRAPLARTRSVTTAPAATVSSPRWSSDPRCPRAPITAGGESGHPESKHFTDEAERYTTGNLRTVYFWPEQLEGHTERTYRPGE